MQQGHLLFIFIKFSRPFSLFALSRCQVSYDPVEFIDRRHDSPALSRKGVSQPKDSTCPFQQEVVLSSIQLFAAYGHVVQTNLSNDTFINLSNDTFIILIAAYGHVVQTDPRAGDQGLPPGSKKGCPERGCPANSGHRFSWRHWARLKRPGGQSTLGSGEYSWNVQSSRSWFCHMEPVDAVKPTCYKKL